MKKGQDKGRGQGQGQGGDDDGQDDGDEEEGEMSDRTAREDSETARDDTLMDADDIIDGDDHDNGGGDGDGGTRARAGAGASVRAGISAGGGSTVHRTMSRAGSRDGPSSEGVEDKEQADRLVYHMLQQVIIAIYLYLQPYTCLVSTIIVYLFAYSPVPFLFCFCWFVLSCRTLYLCCVFVLRVVFSCAVVSYVVFDFLLVLSFLVFCCHRRCVMTPKDVVSCWTNSLWPLIRADLEDTDRG